MKMNKVGEVTLSCFKTQCKATFTKKALYRFQNRQTDQWNITENPEIHPYTCGQTIFLILKISHERKESLLNK